MKQEVFGRFLVVVQIVLMMACFGVLVGMRYSVIGWRPALMAVGGGVLAMAVIGFIGLLTVYLRFRGGRTGGMRYCMIASALAAVPVGFVLLLGMKSRDVPPIHDITTDMKNPPMFKVLAEKRQKGENSPVYKGAEVAKLQEGAYPEISPVEFDLPMERVYAKAVNAATAMGWRIIAKDPGTGHIEAVDTTPLLKFKDDIVIRISSHGKEGCRLDIRSASRVGVSDFGTNARRIKEFIELLEPQKN